ncbi:sucrase ferredoxin [Leptolyngbya sp. AN03gr2]|uniref:sucrase ferredoxin n=1 Tax=unclassified Leptolyngbya TaxID=2650499 RepID=UPI003D3102B9
MSHESGEELIGSAPNSSMYVLIECPLPWASKAIDSKKIPLNLRETIQKIRSIDRSIRFLLFLGESRVRSRVMVFRKVLPSGYHKREFELESIDQVAPLLEQHLNPTGLEIECYPSDTQDVFVCTHGSHDKCCAKFGYPFYRQALKLVDQFQLSNTRFWQVSHIGGHRFAPTIVTFPDGRYYGALDETSLSAILQRSGDIQCLNRVYRGWGILPAPIQVMEREIALQRGWDWFQYQVHYRILEPELMHVELRCEKPGDETIVYTARIIEAESQMILSSCNSNQPTQVRKFAVENLQFVDQRSHWADYRKQTQETVFQLL